MPSVDHSTIERLRRSSIVAEDVWFLSGPTKPGEAVLHIPVDGSPHIVGRKSGVSLKLHYRTVSGQHAALWVENGALMLKDMGSTNGTYINGKRIEEDQTFRISEEDLIHFAEAPFRVRRQSPTGMTNGTYAENVCDQALALVQFDRLMSERLVRPHFQSIIDIKTSQSIGFEILGRGSVFGLESVGAMFQAAEQLNLEVELSRLLRWEGIRVGRDLPDRPTLFVNTHPREMEDGKGLIDSLVKVRDMTGNTDLVLEIHESAVTNPALMQSLSSAMNDLNIRLAYDDFGSGQARLAELIEARPHFVKFDISLVRGIDRANDQRRGMLATLVKMVRDLDIQALAEGIETPDEADVCRELGFDLAQGFFYGRPSPA
ncbi:Putative cyclic-di-GMP phosphodiesterase AdrB [Rubripirellula lacrimiformis]|uniref:Cyclic-di-GMP phosphodiesterase AdrB n=1 Tax=Rubripirellula lacrimiformis TaxID=1930273 RepID=A0A517NCC8_9BACT|nr:EAL domain-containing protein [Rubripirellula lacrimiformis]QDT04780.1 Putative cyclic-di-GMP phosphodiesterase AdrB [Rubripirellula lacrimiformis]